MVGDVLAGRYELQELVGAGGMSSVFRAHDRVLERTVALKVLHQRLSDEDEYVERFRREARMVAGLSHQNIVTVIDRGEDDGRPFIVFEFVAGQNLKEIVERDGPMAVERALELAMQIARGLAFAHANGYVHRDVKPQNVLLNGDGQAKVTDFGIARSLDVKHGVTQTGTVLGTSDYIAPEQAQGRPVDEHTDVYSLGIVLYELLTGELPFTGDNFVAVAMRHINEPPPSLSAQRADVPPRVDAAVQKALAKEPNDRWATMADFGRELEACLEELRTGGPAGAATMLIPPRAHAAPVRRPRGTRRPLWPWLLLVVLGIVVAALAYEVVHHTGGSGNRHGGGSGSSGARVALQGVGDYPTSAGDSHSGTAGAAVDGNPSSVWYTQIYATPNFGGLANGLGPMFDAATSVKVTRLTVDSPTPGFRAQVYAGDSPSSLSPDSATKTVGSSTTFDLNGKTARYYAVYITRLPSGGKAEISEVRAER